MGGILNFVIGGAVGTAIGLAIASLAAPKKGTEFQDDVRQRIADTQAAGEEAERLARSQMEEKFRRTVGDAQAFKSPPTSGGPLV